MNLKETKQKTLLEIVMKNKWYILVPTALFFGTFLIAWTQLATNNTLNNEDILLMREEEKLARDVYLTLYEKWDSMVFDHISQSEQKHMDMMKGLIDAYNLEDPVAKTEDKRGVFVNPTLQALYHELVEEGLKSEAQAYAIGAKVEELDIRDLENAKANTTDEQTLKIYNNLQRASRNHLRAYNRNLTRVGGSYEPVYLDKETYLAILDGPQEHGNDEEHGEEGHQCNGECMGNGNGNGNHQGEGMGKGKGNGNHQGQGNGNGNGQGGGMGKGKGNGNHQGQGNGNGNGNGMGRGNGMHRNNVPQ